MAKGDYTITVDVRKLQAIIAQSPQVMGTELRKLAFEGERYVKQSFGTGSKGRQYGNHTASGEGSPPAVDTGKLRNSINVKKVGTFGYSINTGDTEYAPHLEFGTTKMGARPFMLPMAVWLRGQMNDENRWRGIAK